MSALFIPAFAAILAMSVVALYRVAIGATVFDRLLAAGAVGTNTIALMAIIGFLFARPDMFVDLALTYAQLSTPTITKSVLPSTVDVYGTSSARFTITRVRSPASMTVTLRALPIPRL